MKTWMDVWRGLFQPGYSQAHLKSQEIVFYEEWRALKDERMLLELTLSASSVTTPTSGSALFFMSWRTATDLQGGVIRRLGIAKSCFAAVAQIIQPFMLKQNVPWP